MYIGERHSAETRETIDVEYRCRWCGLAKWARSSSRGVGTARSPYFVDREGARDRAATSATSDALDIAEAALAYVKCPGCGKTNAEKNAGRSRPPRPARDDTWVHLDAFCVENRPCVMGRRTHRRSRECRAGARPAIPQHYPWLDQFFGLPAGTDLVVEMGARVSVPVLWRPDPIAPIAGSYVASLNAAARG